MNTQENLKRIEDVVEMSNEQRDEVFRILVSIQGSMFNKGFLADRKEFASDEPQHNYLRDRYGSDEYYEYISSNVKVLLKLEKDS